MQMKSIGSEMYDTITNYNDRNNTQLPSAKIREAIYKLMLEEQEEANNIKVDKFSPHINEGDYLIGKVANLTINDVGNDLINKFAN